jgi:hypothetical protein
MSDFSGAIGPVLSALRTLPLWILIGLAFAGYAVLFAPAFGGINPEPFRQQWGVWVWIGAITFSILALARVLEAGVSLYWSHKRTLAARRILRFVPLQRQCWWHLAKQRDDSFVSQLALDIQISNTSDQPVQIVKTRLIRPKAKLIHADASLPMRGSPYYSDDHPVPPRGTVAASVHIMVRGSLAAQGRPLRITIGITDQYGEEYKIKNVYITTHDLPIKQRSLLERLRHFQAFKWNRSKPQTPSPIMPWAFSPGHEYLEVCQSILSEEKRSYAANGRIRGGLGTFNVTLQSEPNYGVMVVGQIPQLLWDRDGARPVSSPNLDRLVKTHETLSSQDRDNLERYLLSQLSKESPFAEVAYFVFLALHRVRRTMDALQTARTFLAGDKVYGYSNLLGILSAVISHEHFDIDPKLYQGILDALPNNEHDFRLKEKINLAKLQYLDRQRLKTL